MFKIECRCTRLFIMLHFYFLGLGCCCSKYTYTIKLLRLNFTKYTFYSYYSLLQCYSYLIRPCIHITLHICIETILSLISIIAVV